MASPGPGAIGQGHGDPEPDRLAPTTGAAGGTRKSDKAYQGAAQAMLCDKTDIRLP